MSIERIVIDETAVEDFVKAVAEQKPMVLASYLVMSVLEIELRKAGKDSPIKGLDPVTMQLIKEIMDRNPDFDTRKAGKFKGAVSRYLYSNDYAGRWFKYEPLNDGV